jgi:heme/copper-type cytochrome/quinol oxidase subunit 2
MIIVPIVLLVVLVVVVFSANSMKKKGTMTESAYQALVSVSSVIVTVAALVVMFLRIRG